jgi:outer membrane receptor for ferric coprogen and ferric-rhodotorulic acid
MDMEYSWKGKFSVGASAKYFSKIVNMDAIITEFENFTTDYDFIQNLQYQDFFAAHRFGNWIFDARISFNFSDEHKLALIGTNILNRTYSLRPLKIEPPRTFTVQYTYKLEGKGK